MQQAALKSSVILCLLLGVMLTIERPQAIAHGRGVHRNPSDAVVFSAIPPQRARQLLSSIVPLNMTQQKTKDVDVKSNVLCFCLSKAGEAIGELRRIQAEWFDKGRTSFKAQNYTEAITAFSRVINMNVNDASVYTYRGLSYANRGDYRQALQDLTQAIDLNHHQAEAYYARGLIAVIVDDMPAARLDLRTAFYLNYAPAQRLIRRVNTDTSLPAVASRGGEGHD
jgi:tetratricopeptide (TPR) repeat protein